MKIWTEEINRNGKPVKVWRADFTLMGRRYRVREASKKDLDEAIDALRARARRIRLDLPEEQADVTLCELIAARQADQEFKRRVTYARGCRVLDDFGAYFSVDQLVCQITSADVSAYLRDRHANLEAAGVNGYLGFISAMFRQADVYFPALAQWQRPRLPYAQEPAGRERTLSLKEAQALVAWLRAPVERALVHEAREKVADMLQLALMSAMRQGEWRKRQWAEIDFETNTITLSKTKTGKGRVLFMSPAVRAILERRFNARHGSPYIFPGALTAKRPMSESSIRQMLARAAAALKIPYGRNVEGGFTFHDTRHTAISQMLLAGHDLATIADISGHTKKSMTLRYSHATVESRQRALSSLEPFAFEVTDHQQTGQANKKGA